jgi:integrase
MEPKETRHAPTLQINRELAALKRMFNLALHAEKISRKPYISMLEENNARQGFFERPEFDAVLAKLPDYLRPPMTLTYWTGWRLKSEILPLTWSQVDFDTGVIRLEPGVAKNKDGRHFPLMDELRALLESQWEEHLTHYPECPWVFHYRGACIVTVSKAWRRACQAIGLSGKILHDFCRTAVRNLVRAGVPERVAMMLTGHKTRSVFDRYHIVSDRDLREAVQKLSQTFSPANGHTFGHTALSPRAGSAVSH